MLTSQVAVLHCFILIVKHSHKAVKTVSLCKGIKKERKQHGSESEVKVCRF